jgi:hypothetical protein
VNPGRPVADSDLRELRLTSESERAEPGLPPGSGIALIGGAMMVVGAFGPWIGGKVFGAATGIELGGDGWLVFAAAALALVPVVLRVSGSAARGAWVSMLALVAAYVCWTHYTEARADGVQVVWGLELAGVGCALLAFAGLRLLLDRS